MVAPTAPAPVLKVRQADWISSTAEWGVGAFFVMIGCGWCVSLNRTPITRPTATPAPVASALPAAVPTPPPMPAPVVDVNGPHVILHSLGQPRRDWSHVTVELNRYWTFTTGALPASTSLCIEGTAFTV